MDDVKLSKWLSYVLRHKPEDAGLTLDQHGWVDIDTLLLAAGKRFPGVQLEDIFRVVSNSDKQRFQIVGDGGFGAKIRANQGHSVNVDLQLQPKDPPAVLYHGTKAQFIDSIREKGLVKGNRHHVHLSPDKDTAVIVASRRKGESVILEINTAAMLRTHQFFLSDNGVWLVNHVPPVFIHIIN